MKLIAEVYWDKGSKISNQDSVSLQEIRICGKKALFALVCDGIGGLQEGETASGLVAERMTEWFYRECMSMLRRHKSRKKLYRSGLRALYGCNEELRNYALKKGLKLGTTATMLVIWDGKYVIWHSGDTRVYRIKTGGMGRWRHHIKLKQLTKDHTVDNHTLVRCIGSFDWKEPDVYGGSIKGTNTIVLCSDGFRNRVREDRLAETLHPSFLQSGEQIRRRLRELAEYVKRQGEQDNISAIAIRIN